MSTEITTTARRIARAVNQCGPALAGGKLVFDAEGNGGEWYSARAFGFADRGIVYPVGWQRVTQREVQEHLDEMARDDREWEEYEEVERDNDEAEEYA